MKRVLDFFQMDPTRGTYNFRLLELSKSESKSPKIKPTIPAQITELSNNQVAPEDDPYLFHSICMDNLDEESRENGRFRGILSLVSFKISFREKIYLTISNFIYFGVFGIYII
jgi:hypothetical protein